MSTQHGSERATERAAGMRCEGSGRAAGQQGRARRCRTAGQQGRATGGQKKGVGATISDGHRGQTGLGSAKGCAEDAIMERGFHAARQARSPSSPSSPSTSTTSTSQPGRTGSTGPLQQPTQTASRAGAPLVQVDPLRITCLRLDSHPSAFRVALPHRPRLRHSGHVRSVLMPFETPSPASLRPLLNTLTPWPMPS